MQDLYFIAGMHRLGASCVAELLASSGLYTGTNLIEAAPDNPRGFFEDQSFVGVNEKILGVREGWRRITSDSCCLHKEGFWRLGEVMSDFSLIFISFMAVLQVMYL